jgi:surface antigen
LMLKQLLAGAAVAALAAASVMDATAAQNQNQNNYQNQQDRAGPRDVGRGQDRYNQGYEEGYDEGYMSGYRRGFDDARANRRFNDRVVRDNDQQPDEKALWTARYQRLYTYNDDIFYRECRNQQADPRGVIANALIGGLLGQGGAQQQARTAADPGVIIGGPAGTNLLNGLTCEDRSYAYQVYYQVLNNERPNQPQEWRNVRTGRRATFVVDRFYEDPDGFRCANFTQTTFYQGRTNAVRGRACQQPDEFWAVVG